MILKHLYFLTFILLINLLYYKVFWVSFRFSENWGFSENTNKKLLIFEAILSLLIFFALLFVYYIVLVPVCWYGVGDLSSCWNEVSGIFLVTEKMEELKENKTLRASKWRKKKSHLVNLLNILLLVLLLLLLFLMCYQLNFFFFDK